MILNLILLLIPVLLLPLLLRMIVSPIILFIAKKAYLPEEIAIIQEGWSTHEDEAAAEKVAEFATNRLKAFGPAKYNVKEDTEAILLLIQNTYQKKKKAKATFSFSAIKLIKCSLLMFSDLYQEYADSWWFKFIGRFRLSWYSRLRFFQKVYEMVFSPSFMRVLKESRLLGKVLRIVLIPILGIPGLLVSFIQSITIGILSEGIFRYLYALILLKIGYYAIYLYGRKNTAIAKRIKSIPKKNISEIALLIEETIKPGNITELSSFHPAAVKAYEDFLRESEMDPDPLFVTEEKNWVQHTGHFFKRLGKSYIKAYTKYNPLYKPKGSEIDKMKNLSLRIAQIYSPKKEHPLWSLRLREVLAFCYYSSVLIVHKVFITPGAGLLLDQMPLDIAVKAGEIASQENVKETVKGISEGLKWYRLFSRGKKMFNIFRGITAPYSLIWTFGSPGIIQQAQNLFKEYIYHRSGRLWLYTWECNAYSHNPKLEQLLWEKPEQ